jgi:hypothetical protein
MTDAEITAWLERTRAAQGLGPKITDPIVLARLITLALGPAPVEDEGGGGRAPAP